MATAMTPWRRNLGLLEPIRQEMEELLDRFFRTEGGNGASLRAWAPQVDVKETDKDILVMVDLPGVDAKDIEITVVEGVLTIRGEKKEEREETKENYYRAERFIGQFYREIPLPPGVDADKVSAATAKGVLAITIPKKAEAQPRKIPIQAQD